MSPETLELLVRGLLVLAIGLYAILGGADFGAGVWEFNLGTRPAHKERKLISKAIGPVWEVNHIWLLFALILLFTCYPSAFGALTRGLFLPLFLALFGIVARGIGFVFRSYAPPGVAGSGLWTLVFALASAATPFFLGTCLGALATGHVLDAPGEHPAWTSPLAIHAGFLAILVCSFLAAVFLIREARLAGDSEQAETWRQRALVSGAWAGVAALVGLELVSQASPTLAEALFGRGLPWVLLSFGAGSAATLGAALRWDTLALLAAPLATLGILGGLLQAQLPFLVPPSITFAEAATEPQVLRLVLIGSALGALLLVPALILLLRTFKRST